MKTALKNIRRSPYQALSAILIVSLTMFVLSVFTLVTLGSHTILLNFETKPQIIAYLKDDHTQEQIVQLLSQITTTKGVKKAVYISKEDALNIYKESVNNDPVLLGTVTDWGIVTADILPASIEITAENPQSFEYISQQLEKSDIISTTPNGQKEIDFPKDVITQLTKWTNAIRSAGLILVGALAVISVFTISLIISLKISTRRQEIKTLRLMGASNLFIIKPYLQESVIYSLLGSLFGWLIGFIGLLYSTPFLSEKLSGIIEFPVSYTLLLILLGGMMVAGLILGLFSGYLATVRFLKRAR